MARRTRRHARRRNGVGAYHVRFGRLLKKANLKGKSAAVRKATFKRLIAKAKAGKASAADRAAAKKANAAYVIKRRARKVRRGGKTRAEAGLLRRGRRPAQLALLNPRRRSAKAQRMNPRRRLPKRMLLNPRRRSAKARRTNPLTPLLYSRKARKASRKARKARRGARRSMKALRMNPPSRLKASRKARKARRGARRSMKALRMNPRRRSMKMLRNRGMRRASSRRASKRGMFAGALSAAKGFSRGLFTPAGLLSAAAVGVAHGVVAPKVHEALAKYLPQSIELPLVGRVSASSFSYTLTGALAGAALAVVGKKMRKPAIEKMGYAAALSGVVLDVVGLVQGSEYGEIFLDGQTYGELSVDGMTYGELSVDGMTYGGISADGVVEYGDVMIAEYADAMLADAEDSGADFSQSEGQALMAGPFAWLKRFGSAPKRAIGVRTAKSRHAGREGHRWGWLVKLVGPEKAAQIAALPPQKRLQVIADLRRQAVSSLANVMAEKAAQTTAAVAPANLLSAPQDMGLDLTGGVSAPGGALGYGAIYAGAGF